MSRLRAIGRSFGAAAATYDEAASLQRLVAHRLAGRIAAQASRIGSRRRRAFSRSAAAPGC